jgi:hypothetical protein
MQRITNAVIAFALTFGLSVASTARAEDTSGDAQTDARAAHVKQDPSRRQLTLALDTHDESGLTVRLLQLPSDAASASGDAVKVVILEGQSSGDAVKQVIPEGTSEGQRYDRR